TPRVLAMMTGGEDMATALDAEPTPEALRFPKMLVHMAAKACGVLSLGPILNNAFAPSAEKLDEARNMIAAAEAAAKEGKGAFVFNGKMVDEPVVARAKALLAKAR